MITRNGVLVTGVKVNLPKCKIHNSMFLCWAFAKYVKDCHLLVLRYRLIWFQAILVVSLYFFTKEFFYANIITFCI